MTVKLLIINLLLCVFGLVGVHGQTPSVLSQGQNYRLAVVASGVYKIDATFLKNAGINVGTINPQNIRIFGNGGAMLPQANSQSRPQDLTENAIVVQGEADGRFDDTDAIWFYGQSPHRVFYDNTDKRFRHETNVYSDTTFYYLQLGTQKGLRVVTKPSVSATNAVSVFDDYAFREQDSKNILAAWPFAGSGREWFGEDFGLLFTNRTIDLNRTGIVANSQAQLTVSVLGASQVPTQMGVKFNEQAVGNLPIGIIYPDRYEAKGVLATQTFGLNISNGNESKVALTFDRGGANASTAYLNYVGLQTQRELKAYDTQTLFRNVASSQNSEVQFSIKNVDNSLKIWNITNPLQPYEQSHSQGIFGTKTEGKIQEYVMFREMDLLKPLGISPVPTQNLSGLEPPQFLIITAPFFREEAQRLANFRRTRNGLSVAVVSTQEVFNEFGGGSPDVSSIRDFIRYLYKKKPSTLRYVLLFGAAKFDPKNRLAVVPESQLPNYVPVYESRESLSPIYSYSSDDYFGFLEDSEGQWEENFSGDHTLDVGIGRLPVKTIREAKALIDKLIAYDNSENRWGEWRRNLLFVADDGDYNIHQQDADYLAERIKKNQPYLFPEKAFVDAFPQINVSTGQKAPALNARIDAAMNNSLIVNYTGHGGESGWAEEQILTFEDIQTWNNTDHQPLIVTATCQFGRYDDPNQTSGAELALLRPKVGAIGLLTTTRPVFANTNFLLNQAFYEAIFKPLPDGSMPRLGDVMKATKNNSLSGRINRNFSLLGDPSMRLAYPEQSIILTKINQKSVGNDTLRALQTVNLQGEIWNKTLRNQGFNGKIWIRVYDKESTTTTKGTESAAMKFQERKDVLFVGTATVKNGAWSCSFVMPKDSRTAWGKGKILLYATDTQTDAVGTYDEAILGGQINTTDAQAPVVQVFMNDETFKDGGQTDENPTFLAKLSDANGMNIAPDKLVLTLDDTLSYDVAAYYWPEIDNFKEGKILFPFKNLANGKHTLNLRTTDTYNNSGRVSLRFEVTAKEKSSLREVYCMPNPVLSEGVFRFTHDFEGENADITLQIYDALGRVVYSQTQTNYRIENPYDALVWNGLGNNGRVLPQGLYFYRIFVRSLTSAQEARGGGKVFLMK